MPGAARRMNDTYPEYTRNKRAYDYAPSELGAWCLRSWFKALPFGGIERHP
jgi:hypothetical protein